MDVFLKSDIPLHKLRYLTLKNLFNDLGNILPAKTYCKRHVETIYNEDIAKIKSLLYNKIFFYNLR